ncbi:MAG: hydroxymethylbilane synthase [Gemmatimonadota bacterium]
MVDSAERLVRIASRGSQLALWQAESVRAQLIEAHSALRVEIAVVKTTGDKILDVPLARIGDRGLFTKELDEAILAGRADLAVHSLKDVPTTLPDGLTLGAIGRRADPRDALIGPLGGSASLADLPPGARVGTSSLRRRAQLRHVRPDIEVLDLRGNLNTRLRKLDAGEYDAVILAVAGVVRLGLADRISERLDPPDWLPAVGQGALAIVARAEDMELSELLRAIHDPLTADCVAAERALLRSLEGGCQIPIGALATQNDGQMRIDGLVADIDGEHVLRGWATGRANGAEALGLELADILRNQGADAILRDIRGEPYSPGIPAP